MKIFIVGAFGFIGRRFIKKFHNKYDLVAFGKNESAKEFMRSNNNVVIHTGDVSEVVTEAIKHHKPDIVIHLAALTGLVKCSNDPKKAFLTNVIGTHNVIEGCLANNARLIFISSREVYGETKIGKTREGDSYTPNNVYGVTKMIGEEMINHAHEKKGLNFTVLRLTNVYGPEGDTYGSQIIIKNALKGYVNVLGGMQRLNFVYVDDVIDVIDKTISEPRAVNEIFNVGSEFTMTINEFVEKVLKHIPRDVKVNYLPMRNTETSNFEPDLEKMHTVLQIKPLTDIDTGIRKTIEWYSKISN